MRDGGTITVETGGSIVVDGVTVDSSTLAVNGLTASAAELNILDGVTASAAELNKLDGLNASTAELNILAGVTADAGELNLLDGSQAGTAVASKALIAGAGKLEPLGMTINTQGKAADFNVLATDSGKVFIITGVDKVATLPATAAGLRFSFLVTAGALSAGTGFSISPNASDKIMGAGLTPADDKDLINDGATDAEGDLIELLGDGTDGWYVIRKLGTWSREA